MKVKWAKQKLPKGFGEMKPSAKVEALGRAFERLGRRLTFDGPCPNKPFTLYPLKRKKIPRKKEMPDVD